MSRYVRRSTTKRRTSDSSGRPATRDNRAPTRDGRQTMFRWVERVGQDPLFTLTAAQNQVWIDPFTAAAVPVTGSLNNTASKHWQTTNLPSNPQALSPSELLVHRWYHDLLYTLPRDRRFRLFTADGWIDPHTGNFMPGITPTEQGVITQQAAWSMARILAENGSTDTSRLLDLAVLINLYERYVSERDQSIATSHEDEDLAQAASIQTKMMGAVPDIAGYDLGINYAPHSSVGGDFYLFLTAPNGDHRIILGDVTGHGVQAAMVATSATTTLKLLSSKQPYTSTELLVALNSEIKPDLNTGQFITCCVVDLDPVNHRAEIILAGHHPAMVANTERQELLRQYGKKGAAIGLLPDDMLRKALQADQINLSPDDTMLLFTDGVSESLDAKGNEFGTYRPAAIILEHAEESVHNGLEKIANQAEEHRDGASQDDVTLLAFRRRDISAESTMDGSSAGETSPTDSSDQPSTATVNIINRTGTTSQHQSAPHAAPAAPEPQLDDSTTDSNASNTGTESVTSTTASPAASNPVPAIGASTDMSAQQTTDQSSASQPEADAQPVPNDAPDQTASPDTQQAPLIDVNQVTRMFDEVMREYGDDNPAPQSAASTKGPVPTEVDDSVHTSDDPTDPESPAQQP